jgi:hypothetical protein
MCLPRVARTAGFHPMPSWIGELVGEGKIAKFSLPTQLSMDTPGTEPGAARRHGNQATCMLSGRDNQLHHVPIYDRPPETPKIQYIEINESTTRRIKNPHSANP